MRIRVTQRLFFRSERYGFGFCAAIHQVINEIKTLLAKRKGGENVSSIKSHHEHENP